MAIKRLSLFTNDGSTSSLTTTIGREHSSFIIVAIISPLKTIIEIQGQQHNKFTPHFHKTLAGFKHAQYLDNLKKEWAEMNDFKFVEVPVSKFDPDKFEEAIVG